MLVFGESEHDRRAIKRLVEGLRPDLDGKVEERRRPLVLIKGTLPGTARSNAAEIAQLARAACASSDVLAVLAHQDCGALEPAHEEAAETIERELAAAQTAHTRSCGWFARHTVGVVREIPPASARHRP